MEILSALAPSLNFSTVFSALREDAQKKFFFPPS